MARTGIFYLCVSLCVTVFIQFAMSNLIMTVLHCLPYRILWRTRTVCTQTYFIVCLFVCLFPAFFLWLLPSALRKHRWKGYLPTVLWVDGWWLMWYSFSAVLVLDEYEIWTMMWSMVHQVLVSTDWPVSVSRSHIKRDWVCPNQSRVFVTELNVCLLFCIC